MYSGAIVEFVAHGILATSPPHVPHVAKREHGSGRERKSNVSVASVAPSVTVANVLPRSALSAREMVQTRPIVL